MLSSTHTYLQAHTLIVYFWLVVYFAHNSSPHTHMLTSIKHTHTHNKTHIWSTFKHIPCALARARIICQKYSCIKFFLNAFVSPQLVGWGGVKKQIQLLAFVIFLAVLAMQTIVTKVYVKHTSSVSATVRA